MNGYKDPKFYTTTGKLTAYALACGYVEVYENGWKLFRDGCYHLRRSRNYGEWLTFATLKEAQKAYTEVKRTREYVPCVECRGTGERLTDNLVEGLTKRICLACSGHGNRWANNENEGK